MMLQNLALVPFLQKQHIRDRYVNPAHSTSQYQVIDPVGVTALFIGLEIILEPLHIHIIYRVSYPFFPF